MHRFSRTSIRLDHGAGGPRMLGDASRLLRSSLEECSCRQRRHVTLSHSRRRLAWRETLDFDGEVYAGVMVLPSASMAGKLMAAIPKITVPSPWLDAIESDRTAGTKLACEFAQEIAESGVFDGVHLIPGVRYRETAASLEKLNR